MLGNAGLGGAGAAGGGDENVLDNSESISISSLALLKMLKHGRGGVPLEVMCVCLSCRLDEKLILCGCRGLMLG